jgi:hypothetical protein
MSQLPDHPYQARSHEIYRMRRVLTMTKGRKIGFVRNISRKMTIRVIVISLVIIVLELLIATKPGWLVNQQTRRIDMDSFGNPFSGYGATTDTTTIRSTIDSVRPKNLLLYTGSFGIGHRMSKLSCVYHLLLAHKNRSDFYKYLSTIKVVWGICPTTTSSTDEANLDIFEYLFGSQYISLADVNQQRDSVTSSQVGATTFITRNIAASTNPNRDLNILGRKTLWIRNDVAGYYAGQSYKNAKIVLKERKALDIFNDKLQSDYHLFRYLVEHRFIGYNHVQQYKLQHEWDQHYVIGVHIRAGNGEQNHFVQSGRNFVMYSGDKSTQHYQERIVKHIAKSIHQIYINAKAEQPISAKLPIVFLATDTELYIDALTRALRPYQIPLLSFNEQPRIPKGMGVSYDNTIYMQQANISCYQSWYGSMIDMTLLSESDTVIATTRSTFTQIIPGSIAFHQKTGNGNSTYKYCEMDLQSYRNSTKVTCFKNQISWLLRNNSREWNTFSVGCDDANIEYNDCNVDSTLDDDDHPVAHKLMVHFPDIDDRYDGKKEKMYIDALAFLQQETQLPNETVYYYGKKFNKKYRSRRNKGNPEIIQSNWTWE